MSQQPMSTENVPSVSPEISTDAAPAVQPKEDLTYHTTLKNQLQRTYDHMGQHLLARGFLSVELSEESPLLDAASLSGRSAEVVLQEDFDAIDKLLTEMTEETKTLAISAFALAIL